MATAVQLKNASGTAIYPKTLHNVGEVWITVDGSIPDGGLPFLGQNVSKSTYPDLWDWVMAKPERYETSESNWNAHAHDGDNPKFAWVNTTTLKMPRITHWLKGGTGGEYLNEGLPNIEGSVPVVMDMAGDIPNADGAFSPSIKLGTDLFDNNRQGGWGKQGNLVFKASSSNAIYGSSPQVKPKTNTILLGCYASGIVTNIGSLDASKLANDIASIQSGAYQFPEITASIMRASKLYTGQGGGFSDGYILLPNNVLLQFGICKGASEAWTLVRFPKAFASAPIAVAIQENFQSTSNGWAYVNELNTDTMKVLTFAPASGRGTNWIAIGQATL